MRPTIPALLGLLVLIGACGNDHSAADSAAGGADTAGSAGGQPSAGSATGGSSATSGGQPAGVGVAGGSSASSPGTAAGAGMTGNGGASSGGLAGAGQATGGNAGAPVAGSGGASGGGASNGILLPPGNASFDYQIGGAYTPPSGVKVVSRDRGDAPAPGLYNICYVNGFQAQQADDAWWLAQHPDLILRDEQGDPVVDPDWDEMLFDTSTSAKRQALAAVVGDWIEGCRADGFDAVEVDNLDSYSRSGGRLSQANNVAFMQLLSSVGHQAGLAMGQKNSTEVLGSAASMGTDFAVAEECNRYSECGDYKSVYGDLVFVIEYRDQDFSAGCKNFPELSIVRRDVGVSTPKSASYVYQGC